MFPKSRFHSLKLAKSVTSLTLILNFKPWKLTVELERIIIVIKEDIK